MGGYMCGIIMCGWGKCLEGEWCSVVISDCVFAAHREPGCRPRGPLHKTGENRKGVIWRSL